MIIGQISISDPLSLSCAMVRLIWKVMLLSKRILDMAASRLVLDIVSAETLLAFEFYPVMSY